jgi:hypothetical protein
MKSPRMSKPRNIVAAGALVLAGFGGGAALAAGGVADAASSVTNIAQGNDGHADETPLTGTTAAKVKAAALAKYPGATIDRVETDSDGVYEAHIVTKAGDHLEVQIDKNYKVTGTETFSGHGGRDHNDDGGVSAESSTSNAT